MGKAKGKTIPVDQLSPYLRALMSDYEKDVYSFTVEATDKVSKDAMRKLRMNSTGAFKNRRGNYRRGWRAQLKKTSAGNVSATVYNKTDYRLTHLLENGHKVKNQFGGTKNSGKKKDTDAFPHIAGVEEWAIEQFELEIAMAIERANSAI